ncbi:MAG: glycosyltransferase family 39 protein [Candidatus Aminicenantes bacterium]|jgi:hypothetical protein
MNSALNSHQTNGPAAGHDYLKFMAPVIFLLIILFFSAWGRFDEITGQGISRGDPFRQLAEAKRWADGQPPKFAGIFYRPVSYFLQGLSIKIFGYTDYSIKILHGVMDLINILLIFFIAAILAKNQWVGVISSLLYAFLPKVIYLTRSEFPQVESTTLVLLALFFFILFDRQKKRGFKLYFLLFFSGLTSGLAANTHGDIAFLAPGYVVYLFIKTFDSQNKKESLKEFFIFAAIFSFSFFSPFFLGLFIFGAKRVIQILLKEGSVVKWNMDNIYDTASKPRLFFEILAKSIKYYFEKHFLFISIMLSGTIIIIIYRKIKKQKDQLWAYLPLILIFIYVFLYSCFFSSAIASERYFMPLLPLLIFMLTLWYDKIIKQFFGKYSLIGFICLFLILFLLNPKEIPGKRKYSSPYRFIYDILKDKVNPGNRLLISPVSIYSFDRGYRSDLYFGTNAVYVCHLPLDQEYNLKSLTTLLEGMNIGYVFVGKGIDRRLLNPESGIWKYCNSGFNNERNPYSLEKDMKVINDYIHSNGGLLAEENRFGQIYYLTGVEAEQKTSIIANGSFEHWWKGFPMGNWKLDSGRILRSWEATDGSSSIRFEPDVKKGSRIVWYFGNLFKDKEKLRVCLDVKADKTCKFAAFFTAGINGKRQVIKSGKVRYTGKGEWMTIGNDFTITPDMKQLLFHLRLFPGARKPAFVDNLSIEILREGGSVKK